MFFIFASSERRRTLPLRFGSSEIDSRVQRQRGPLLDHEDDRGRGGPHVHREVLCRFYYIFIEHFECSSRGTLIVCQYFLPFKVSIIIKKCCGKVLGWVSFWDNYSLQISGPNYLRVSNFFLSKMYSFFNIFDVHCKMLGKD